MKISKKFVAFLMIMAMGAAAVGCGKKAETPKETPTPIQTPSTETPIVEDSTIEEPVGEVDPTVSSDLVFAITDGIEMPAQMPMDRELFADTYGIDETLLESYVVNMPMMNVKANECAVFELKDEKDVQVVLDGIAKRQEALEAQWKSYLPDQLELVQNYKTAVKGNKVLFVIDENAEKIVENFNKLA